MCPGFCFAKINYVQIKESPIIIIIVCSSLFLFSGTRIIYERKFLLDLKSSPLSQTPTKLPVIPGVTLDDHGKIIEEDETQLATMQEENAKEVKAAATADEKKVNGKYSYVSFIQNLAKDVVLEAFLILDQNVS